MELLPLTDREHLQLAAHWLQRKENYQWLDFGNGVQGVTPTLLKVMLQRGSHFIRLYTAGADERPIGIVGLNNVDRHFKTGTLWGVAGEKDFRHRGLAQLAGSRLLTLAFDELGLQSVNAWAVDSNVSVRSVTRLGFRYVGRQRQCHVIDGRVHDRLLFDLLATEHRELNRVARERQGRDSLTFQTLDSSYLQREGW